jgi:hypothetical protein
MNKLKLDDGRELSLGEIVRRQAWFSFYRQGYLYYNLLIAGTQYSFPIPIDDLGGATVSAEEKAITLMRYIRKAMETDQLVRSK